MNVLSVADPLAIIAPDAVGGPEHMITSLDGALVDAGHASLVVAASGSHCAGELIEVPTSGDTSEAGLSAAMAAVRGLVEEALTCYDIDILHLHVSDLLTVMPRTDIPMLVTLHQPPTWYPSRLFNLDRPPLRFACVSHNQRRSFFADAPVDVITGGVDLTLFQPVNKKEGYVAAVGSICPQQGFHLALEAARLARVPAKLAGAISPYTSHQQYFRDSIVPRLDGERVFVGMLGGLRKRMFLARARALIVASLVDEAGSLAAMEALACGTPVIGMRRGALPELIEHGVTGFLVDGFLDLVDAIAHVGELSPEACRAAAEKRFDARVMQRAYLDLYERMMLDTPLSQTPAPLARTGWRC